MRILIIEDDPNKRAQLTDWAKEKTNNAQIYEAKSYQSGLKSIIELNPEIVLLDMSMPTYDVTATDKGGRERAFAGREILEYAKMDNIECKVIIVTQYTSFGDGENTIKLTDLAKELKDNFPKRYLGTVSYSRAHSIWKNDLIKIINKNNILGFNHD